jgi:ubiquinone/menaquinone biosynthesis C-methylase UbiE
MTPEEYDAWYRTPRGAWIGETEVRLLTRLLAPAPGETMLDVGCGTGYFTRAFARAGHALTGVDADEEPLRFARRHAAAGETYLIADARALPFRDRTFDLCISVTALCFVHEESRALAEMLRVTRRRLAIGLLNRHSLLYLEKGRHGGTGAYTGARWHAPAELRALLAAAALEQVSTATAIFLPRGGRCARWIERRLPGTPALGAFLAAAASVPPPPRR